MNLFYRPNPNFAFWEIFFLLIFLKLCEISHFLAKNLLILGNNFWK